MRLEESLTLPLPAPHSGVLPPSPTGMAGCSVLGLWAVLEVQAGGRLNAWCLTMGRASGAAAATLDVRWTLLADLYGYGPYRDPRSSLSRGAQVMGSGLCGGLPGAVPQPAPSSQLRTGANNGESDCLIITKHREGSWWVMTGFLPSALNVRVKKFNEV